MRGPAHRAAETTASLAGTAGKEEASQVYTRSGERGTYYSSTGGLRVSCSVLPLADSNSLGERRMPVS